MPNVLVASASFHPSQLSPPPPFSAGRIAAAVTACVGDEPVNKPDTPCQPWQSPRTRRKRSLGV